jgi:hypothetical protein
MSKEAAKCVPEHKSYDLARDLKQDRNPHPGPRYAVSDKELQVLGEWLKEMLKTGKIWGSKSIASVLILFMLKAYGRGLHLYIDYRDINKITIANRSDSQS